MTTPHATLAEVARMAGVSLSTASRVLNGSDRLPAPELREKVIAAAARLDYSPNAAAQAIARGRADILGLIVNDISDPYFSGIADGVMRAADELPTATIIADARGDPERELSLISVLRRQRVRAIVLAGSRRRDRQLTGRLQREIGHFRDSGGGFALISQKLVDADTVWVDNRGGARALAEQLAGLGYDDVAALAGPADLITSNDRIAGFRQGLARHGRKLPAERVWHNDFNRDGGYRGVHRMLDDGVRPQLLFVVNDVMAVGAMSALRDRGLRTPDDVAVAGFDDIQWTRDTQPALTTVRVDLAELGRTAVRLALDAEAHHDAEPRFQRARVEVVLRGSTPDRRPMAG